MRSEPSFPKGFVSKLCYTGSQACEVIVDLSDITLKIDEGLSVTVKWVMGAKRVGGGGEKEEGLI